jgi:chromosome segregation ATPase
LKEEDQAQKLITQLEDSQAKRYEFELKALQEREKQLEDSLKDYIDKGDALFDSFRSEVNTLTDTESDYSDNFNQLSNQQNMLLRSKLNYNRGEIERLRRLGQQAGGALGKDLERVVEQSDKLAIDIVANKKDQHKGLIEIREVMRCDIGNDQKPFTPDTK